MVRTRYQTIVIILFLFVFCSNPHPVWAQAAQSVVPAISKNSLSEFSAEKAYAHILHLSQKIGPRPAGSKNELKAAQYLRYILEQAGWKVREQPFSKIVVNPNLLSTENRIQVINSQNIIAELPGDLQDTILLGAHYDTVDAAPGAVDNASGVGVVLELARVLGKAQHQETYQIVFFGAEEYGLVGSSYYVAQSDLSAIRWMLNLDMVGTPLEIDIAGKNQPHQSWPNK
jgi:acetylornithine deacetylase/succinyl-diaminopimelate desuccinylase-like protein